MCPTKHSTYPKKKAVAVPKDSQKTTHKHHIRTYSHLHTNRLASPQASDCINPNTPGSSQENLAKKSSTKIEHQLQSSNM
jgi:hypothetical protein